MDSYKELKMLYTSSESALIEYLSFLWVRRCGRDYRDDIYSELVEITEHAKGIKKMS